MTKIRVHELAKQLDKDNKDIINKAIEHNIDVKNHMSTLTEEEVKLIQSHFSAPKVEETTGEEKKKNISQVYNPQNSRANTGRPQNNNQRTPYNKTQTSNQNTNQTTNQNASRPTFTQNANTAQNFNQNRNNSNQNANNTNSNSQNSFLNRNQGTQPKPTNNTNVSVNSSNNNRNNNPVNKPYNNRENTNTNTPNRGTEQATNYKPANTNRTEAGNRPNANSTTNTANRQNTNTNRPNPTGNYQNTNNNANSNASRPNNAANRPNSQQGARNNQQQGNRFNQGNQNKQTQDKNYKGGKNNNMQAQQKQFVPVKEKEEVIKTIILPEKLTIKLLAEKMKMQPSALVKKLFLQGTIVTVNNELDYEAAEEIALEYNFMTAPEVKIDVIKELLKEEEESEADLVPRPPVICVMGHVDHGKTSLLDAIRQSNVTEREAGGITQHIGAYTVNVNNQKITFLDTPGHEAFTSMRMRGANATDIAILVVAADDGVMPQTVEAINHAKAAEIEIIVAINKMDKASANLDRVKQELSEYNLIPEDWGGDTIFVPVSAHTKEGIDQLLEMILLTAEICELKANPKRKARGLVIEAKLDKAKGSVATILVQKGTLYVGDNIAVGSCYGKIRAMTDDKGRRLKEAGPSTPIEILGLNNVPNAGEIFVITENDKEARTFAETYISEGREKLIEDTKAKMSLDDLFSQIQAGNLKELGIIVKGDVQGSVEALKQSLLKLSNEEVVVKIIHAGVGAINESDVVLASASNAIIIGFNVRPDVQAKSIADTEKVDLRLYRVIYDAIEDVQSAMKGMLDPIFEEKVIGHAEVRQTFKASGIGTIAGSYVLDGIFQRGCTTRIKREGSLVFEGILSSLKRFKDDVKEVKTGYECGLVFEKFNDLKEGDIVEAYIMVEVPR